MYCDFDFCEHFLALLCFSERTSGRERNENENVTRMKTFTYTDSQVDEYLKEDFLMLLRQENRKVGGVISVYVSSLSTVVYILSVASIFGGANILRVICEPIKTAPSVRREHHLLSGPTAPPRLGRPV